MRRSTYGRRMGVGRIFPQDGKPTSSGLFPWSYIRRRGSLPALLSGMCENLEITPRAPYSVEMRVETALMFRNTKIASLEQPLFLTSHGFDFWQFNRGVGSRGHGAWIELGGTLPKVEHYRIANSVKEARTYRLPASAMRSVIASATKAKPPRTIDSVTGLGRLTTSFVQENGLSVLTPDR